MSQTVRSSILQMPVTPSDTVNDALQRNLSPAMLAQSPLRKLAAVLTVALFTFVDTVHDLLITLDWQQNQTGSRILLLWQMSCLYTTVQLEVWLTFVIVPVVQLLCCQLIAWISSGFGATVDFLFGIEMSYKLVGLIACFATCRIAVANNFHITDQNFVRSLKKIWIRAAWISMIIFLCTVCARIVLSGLITVISWFNVAFGLLQDVVLWLMAAALYVGYHFFWIDVRRSGYSRQLWYQDYQRRRRSAIMSQTRQDSATPVTPSDVINDTLRRNFSLAVLEQTPLAFPINAFFAFGDAIHNLVTRPCRPDHSESRILLLWVISCMFAAVQLALVCLKMLVVDPTRFQIICELIARICSGFGAIFSFLIGTVLFYIAMVLIVVIGASYAYNVLVANDFHVNDQRSARLKKIWAYAGVIAVVDFLCTVGGGILIERLIAVICWFSIAVGLVSGIASQLLAICLGVVVIVLGASSILALKQQTGNSRQLWFHYYQTRRRRDIRRQTDVCL